MQVTAVIQSLADMKMAFEDIPSSIRHSMCVSARCVQTAPTITPQQYADMKSA